jgi:amino acid transporter
VTAMAQGRIAVRPEDDQRSRLRRELGRLDTVFFLTLAMVVVDTIGAIAIGGAEAFTWLVVLFVFFFVRSALIGAELGTAMPEEGGATSGCAGRSAGSSVLWPPGIGICNEHE